MEISRVNATSYLHKVSIKLLGLYFYVYNCRPIKYIF